NVTWEQPSKRVIGMVFQSYALYPQMSVKGNLSFGLKNAGVPRSEIEDRVGRAARILQIEELLHRRPAALSGGQRQRVAIGRALVRDVDVFLFDEPLSNLDAKLRSDLRVEIKRLHQRLKNTMIYVTHDQIEALTLADRIAILRDGKIQQLGTPDEIYNRPLTKYVAEFIGSPTMNFFNGRIEEGVFRSRDLEIELDGYQWSGEASSGEAWLGIRPEHVASANAASNMPYSTEIEVELYEPMGSDTLVWTFIGDQSFHFRLDGQIKVSDGDRLSIGFDIRRGSIFDKKFESRL
ncbi:MAG: ATP-binding cassette domain-containing protein, partial [Albidovulum sp.]|nr:ATP-binding cassette domain-containing protein [Albidovulum sp.]